MTAARTPAAGAPGPRGSAASEPGSSLRGVRGGLTVWLPLLLIAVTVLWRMSHDAVPLWWSAPALTAAGALLGDPVVRMVLLIARDTETAERARIEHLEQIRPDTVLVAPAPEEAEEQIQDEEDSPPLRGGLVIGVLERVAVTVCVVGGYTTGIAVVVAVKGLARYGEFTTPSQREQFIIGTLASLLWAAGTAGLILLVSPAG